MPAGRPRLVHECVEVPVEPAVAARFPPGVTARVWQYRGATGCAGTLMWVFSVRGKEAGSWVPKTGSCRARGATHAGVNCPVAAANLYAGVTT